MDLVARFAEQFNWETIMFTLLRVLLILGLAWAALKVLKRLLRKLEQTLIDRSQHPALQN